VAEKIGGMAPAGKKGITIKGEMRWIDEGPEKTNKRGIKRQLYQQIRGQLQA